MFPSVSSVGSLTYYNAEYSCGTLITVDGRPLLHMLEVVFIVRFLEETGNHLEWIHDGVVYLTPISMLKVLGKI